MATLQGMINICADFDSQGYTVVANALHADLLQLADTGCETETLSKAGTRNLLRHEWARNIAQAISEHPEISTILPATAVPVQCTYFEKNLEKNWLVPLHRDLSIPVGSRFDAAGWSGWSEKEGVQFVQPPRRVLESIVAVRVHLENNGIENGPLQVVPGSHRDGVEDGNRVTCEVPKGGALIMRPLLLHASSKLRSGTRRVLHFLFGPANLPDQAEWPNAP